MIKFICYPKCTTCQKAKKWLDDNGIAYEILTNNSANIYGKINLSKLVIALAKMDCEIISSHEQDESLENYFMNLIGGDRHD